MSRKRLGKGFVPGILMLLTLGWILAAHAQSEPTAEATQSGESDPSCSTADQGPVPGPRNETVESVTSR